MANLGTPKHVNLPPEYLLVSSKWKNTELGDLLKKRIKLSFQDWDEVTDFKLSHYAIMLLLEADVVVPTYRRALVKLRKVKTMQSIVIVEKTPATKQYYPNVQQFAVLELDLNVVPVGSIVEAANFISKLVNVETRSPANPLKQEMIPPPMDELRVTFMKQIPKLGETKATALLQKHPSIQSICNSSQLSSILGRAVAKDVQNFMSSHHNNVK